MAIERCPNGHVYDRDWNTECPRCPVERAAVRIAIAEPHHVHEQADVIRQLSEGYPWQAKDAELHKRMKRVLGEA